MAPPEWLMARFKGDEILAGQISTVWPALSNAGISVRRESGHVLYSDPFLVGSPFVRLLQWLFGKIGIMRPWDGLRFMRAIVADPTAAKAIPQHRLIVYVPVLKNMASGEKSELETTAGVVAKIKKKRNLSPRTFTLLKNTALASVK